MDKNDREKILSSLNSKIKHLDGLFEKGFSNMIMRVLMHPVVVTTRFLQMRYKIFNKRTFLVNTKLFFGYRMISHGFSYPLWIGGHLSGAEVPLQKYIIKNLSSRDIFFDIGAHHGFYSLLAHRIMSGGNGSIHSFEPVQLHFNLLKRNVLSLTGTSPEVFCNQIALSSKEGDIEFFEDVGAGSTISRDFYSEVARVNRSIFAKIKVTCNTLDSYCSVNKIKPTFLKIDVEGSEYDVLCGAIDFLKNSTPIIAMEVWSKPYDNTNHIKAINLLDSCGYVIYKIDESGDLIAISKSKLLSGIQNPGKFENYVFKRP